MKHLKAKLSESESPFTSKQEILFCQTSKKKKCEGCECILSKVQETWERAGFKTLSSFTIQKKLTKLDRNYESLIKNKKRSNPKDISNQQAFLTQAQQLFNIGIPNLREEIEADRNRSDKMKEEDLQFLDDQGRINFVYKYHFLLATYPFVRSDEPFHKYLL